MLLIAGGIVFGIAFLGFCGACKNKELPVWGEARGIELLTWPEVEWELDAG